MKKVILQLFLLTLLISLNCYSQDFEIYKEGVAGNTSGQMLSRINSSVLAHDPTTTILLVGTNDIANIPKRITIGQFEENLRDIVDNIRGANSELLLMTIPPIEVDDWNPSAADLLLFEPEGPNGYVDLYNEVVRQVAEEKGAIIVDIHLMFTNDMNLMSSDGIHPSDEGANRMTDLLYNAIAQNSLPIGSLVCFGDSITKRYQDKLGEALTNNPIVNTNVTVPLGGDIQDAIDEAHANGGGVVTLASGTFTITSSLKIKSNVTLEGSGIYASTIKTTQNIKIIEQSGNGLSNITIRNLTLTGTNQVDGGGMDIVSYGDDHDTILLSNVRCYHTGWGVHIKGAKNVTVENCDFSYNGAVGKEGYAHNMYLRRVYGAIVKNSSFNNSTSANGINISYSEDIEIYDCEMIGNYFRGVRAADSDGFLVHNCIVSDNDNVGILANTESVVTKNIDWQNNCVSGNGVGFETKNEATGTVVNNNSFGNGSDYKLVSTVSQSGNISDSSIECGSETSLCADFDVFSIIEAEDACDESGTQTEESSENNLNVGYINNDDWLLYESIDLTGVQSVEARVASNFEGGDIEFRLGSDSGELIGTIPVVNTGGNQDWVTVNTSIAETAGEQDLYLVFKGEGDGYLLNINYFRFSTEVSLSIDEVKTVLSDVSIYPNPVVSSATIKNAEGSTITIYDMNGSIVFTQVISSESELIDLSKMVTGVYYAEVLNSKATSMVKLIKQ